jgi:excisionase family DNA binding protein
MKTFKNYLLKQLREIDAIDAIWFNLDCPWETVQYMMEQISLKAGKLGLPELVVRDISTIHDARKYIATCLQACQSTDILTVKEVAQKLNISARTIYDLVRAGRLKCQRIGKGRGVIRFRPTDLENFRAPTGLRHLHL